MALCCFQVQQRFAKETLNDVADGIPVVGHVKGGIHYACGDKQGGDKAMKSSSRTIGVVAGGVGGMVVAGPVGAVAGGIAGGQAMDGITTGIDSAVHREYRPNGGLINGVGNMNKGEFSAGEGFDVIGGIAFDGLGGYSAGQGVNPGKVGIHGAKPMGQQAIYLGKKVGQGCLPVKEIRGKQFGKAAKAFVPCGIMVFCKACKGTYQAAGRGARFICMNCHNQVHLEN